MQDERLYDATLTAHVRNHGDHVLVSRAHQRRPEHDGEVTSLHLVEASVLHHTLQVQ